MAHVEEEEIEIISDFSEGSSNGANNEGLLPEPIRGVRNESLPPFVTKLYDMVSNKAIDSTISWVGTTSFVIVDKQDFIINLLPKMSKSNNFESFVSQLNNYGFKKISWDRREYAHEWFQKGKRHLLMNIKRKSKRNTSVADKMAYEIEKLKRESMDLDDLNKFKEYVDNTMSNQKRVVQAMADAIKSIFGQYDNVRGAHMGNESECNNKRKATQSLKASTLGLSSFSQNLVIEVEDDGLPSDT